MGEGGGEGEEEGRAARYEEEAVAVEGPESTSLARKPEPDRASTDVDLCRDAGKAVQASRCKTGIRGFVVCSQHGIGAEGEGEGDG